MSDNTNSSYERRNYFCQIILAYLSILTYLTSSQIYSSSSLFGVAFHIPIQNTSIYFTKLLSFRCLIAGLGYLSEYIIYSFVKVFSKSESNRKYISLVNLCLLLITRIVFLILTYFSSQLGYHVYVVICFEAFFAGSLMSMTAIVPEHSVVITLGYNICRLFIPLLQFLIDLFCNKQPLHNVKVMCWIISVLTIFGVMLWSYYIHGHCSSAKEDKKSSGVEENKALGDQNDATEVASFSETVSKALSPFLMYPAGSIFWEFLNPGLLPYAFLHRNKCHIINMLSTGSLVIGPAVLFILENAQAFKEWSSLYDGFWVLTIPMTVIAIYSFMAIHTQMPSSRRIRNSRPIVMAMTLSLVICYSFLYSLNYAGVPKVVHTGFKKTGKKGNNSVITLNFILSLTYKFVFIKLSVGYNVTRVRLGYHPPRFRPNHSMSKSNTFWYFIRHTFSRAGDDAINDFRMNIKDYL